MEQTKLSIRKIEIESFKKIRNLTIKPEDAVAEFIVKKGSDEKYGARPIRRAVQVHMEDLIAEAVLSGTVAAGDTAALMVQEAETPEKSTLHLRRTRKAKK